MLLIQSKFTDTQCLQQSAALKTIIRCLGPTNHGTRFVVQEYLDIISIQVHIVDLDGEHESTLHYVIHSARS